MSVATGFRRFRCDRLKPVLTLTLLLTACASAPPMPQKPITALPRGALDIMCTVLHAEGMASEVRVVKETQPIVTPASLQSLAEVSFFSGKVHGDAIKAILMTPLIPVEVPAQTCISRFVTPQEAARANDVMIIRFSSPFVNPFGRGQTGTLARLSLGNEAATWYWIPLVYRNDRWLAAPPLALSVLE